MEIKKFSKLIKSKEKAQKAKERYMLGHYGTLTDNQLNIICEKSESGRGGIAFRNNKSKKKEEKKENGKKRF